MPSLFLIVGIGTLFLTARGTGPRFVGGRLFPALFAAAFIHVFGGYAIARMTSDPPGLMPYCGPWLTDPQPSNGQHPWLLFTFAIYTVIC